MTEDSFNGSKFKTYQGNYKDIYIYNGKQRVSCRRLRVEGGSADEP